MITHINIKDFATIKDIQVDFHKGLNIITGETGSGKSILASAISLVLGSRADSTYVRTGCDKAIVQMVAEINNREIIITRELSSSGKNLCKIDDEIVTLNTLKSTSNKIADIHGQYDNQSLLNPENHIKLVDEYEKEAIIPTCRRVEDLYTEYINTSKKLAELEQLAEDNNKNKELFEFEIEEIEKANLILGEDTVLEERLIELQNKEEIFSCLDNSYRLAYDNEFSALNSIDNVVQSLKGSATLSKDVSTLEDEFSDIYYRFEDICSRIREAKEKCVYSEEELTELQDRLYFIKTLKQKYGETIDGILDHCEILRKKINTLKNMEVEVESKFLEKLRTEEMLEEETQRLTVLRKKSAMTLQSKIQDELEKLNFKNINISINFLELDNFSSNGRDKVEFLISTNKGEDLKPLSKIASGGEMSRIMLAFKKIIGEYDGIPTMIFDEIDSGISGETASIVGKAMALLSENHQVISITHLPQIASFGNHNYRIEKSSDEDTTYTTINHLNDEEKIVEIARLLSGVNVSELTIESAKEMITLSK